MRTLAKLEGILDTRDDIIISFNGTCYFASLTKRKADSLTISNGNTIYEALTALAHQLDKDLTKP